MFNKQIPTIAEWAWIAGFFEGERYAGCIGRLWKTIHV